MQRSTRRPRTANNYRGFLARARAKVMTRYFRDAERAEGPRSFWARRALYSVFGLCCLSYASAGHTQGDDGPDYSYYVVTAVPGKSLQSLLNAASPIHRNGRVFYAHTDWH